MLMLLMLLNPLHQLYYCLANPKVFLDPTKEISKWNEITVADRGYFFFGKLTYVLKENDTKNIMGIPKIYNVNRNENQQMATG